MRHLFDWLIELVHVANKLQIYLFKTNSRINAKNKETHIHITMLKRVKEIIFVSNRGISYTYVFPMTICMAFAKG